MNYLENLFGLKDKNAVVIGGSGVLAGAMAEGLANAGANIAILARNFEKAEKKAGEITDKIGVKTIAVKVDAANKETLVNAKAEINEKLGKVDILINAPGMTSKTPFLEITEKEWDEIMDINLKSILFGCQVFGEEMFNNKDGSIINISSVASGPPLSKVFAYSATKAAVNSLTQSLAIEWATANVRVNAIAPGFFPAEQNKKMLTKERVASILAHTPMGRFGNPDELVAATIWLASSKAASFVTGSIVRVDGGFTAMTI
ncbi:MAG: SDR family oxidoreductase [Melioribacteraceae bacterium]|nr:SDR family oxidoreductase [Melioribacteraceae bacterium]